MPDVTVNRSLAAFDYEAAWGRAWRAAGARSSGAEVRDALLQRYNEPQRKYHTLQHLCECLQLFDTVRQLPVCPAEVELALWFHDAVYDLKRADNEERSASLAQASLLADGASPEVASRVAALILATRHTSVPRDPDERLVVDIDLAILGTSAERFAEYERQIRDEYAFVPGWLFRRKRRAVLRSFLDRSHIYATPHFAARFEETARANLSHAIGNG